MIDFTKLDSDAVIRHYALANTPRYLYRKLREENSVAAIAASATPRELVMEIESRENRDETTFGDIAIAYALLVAFSFHDFGPASAELATWAPKKLVWGKSIKEIICQSAVVTTMTRLGPPRNGRIVDLSDQSNASTGLRSLTL
jgi:hypothetical protein